MPAMAGANKKAGGTGEGTAPRKVIAQLKATEAFNGWFDRLRTHSRLSAPFLLEHALVEYARNHGFEEQPPER